jgi:hypothetical protein
MAFSGEVLLEAWARSEGRCECQRRGHGHNGRCNRAFLWTLQGVDSASGGWSALRRTALHGMWTCAEEAKTSLVASRSETFGGPSGMSAGMGLVM